MQLVAQQLLLYLVTLRNAAKLVVRHNDAVVVVVLCLVQELYAIGTAIVGLSSKQDLCIGVGRLIGLGNGTHVCLQSDNHRLVAHAQSLHLVCSKTHDERLTAAYLVVADATTVEQQHPNAVLL